MSQSKQTWDIFCKVVDNFGDIGVCWRLAHQLHDEHGLPVRLFVDNLAAAAKLLTGLRNVAEQTYEGVIIVRWDDATGFDGVANVVIETFACGLPPDYLAKMRADTVWINVDYLSAESWVPEFHALNGKHQPSNLTRHFYFPGFNEATGGLLREQNLIAKRNDFQRSNQQQQDFWQRLQVNHDADSLKVSLFSYANAPVEAFLQALVEGEQRTIVCMPLNSHSPTSLLGNDDVAVGDCTQAGNVTLYILPFLNQADYDALLWASDINFVRGEDSWVRAIWAGKPFVWQPYWQEDDAHLLKLNAFLQTFYTHPALGGTLTKLHEAWSTEHFHDALWQDYSQQLSDIALHTQQQSELLIQQDDLTAKLVAFCADLAK